MWENIASAAQNQSGGTSTFELLWSVATIAGMWKMFEKAGRPGWPSLIPFYNTYKHCEIVMGNPWYWLRMFVVIIPVIGWIAAIYFYFQISKATARAYGKPDSWAWGYLLLTPVFYCMTGFGDAEYYGPYGAADNRTSDARGARTVDFDVISNEPSQHTVNETPQYTVNETPQYAEPVQEAEEETVDFTFDQTE